MFSPVQSPKLPSSTQYSLFSNHFIGQKSLSSPNTNLYLLPTTLFKPLNLTFTSYLPSNTPGLLAHHRMCQYLGLQSPSISNSATAPESMLHQLFETESQ